jgi:hypothetical protein
MSDRLTSVLSCLVVMAFAAFVAPCEARDDQGVTARLVIKAQPKIVFDAIRAVRVNDAQELSIGDKQSTLQEHYEGLPVIGKATCTYVEKYTPFKRIDYYMIRSDKFKAFQGSWTITPQDDNLTTVELTSYIDTGIRIPFGRQLTNSQTLKDVNMRLAIVKASAEANQSKVDKLSGR